MLAVSMRTRSFIKKYPKVFMFINYSFHNKKIILHFRNSYLMWFVFFLKKNENIIHWTILSKLIMVFFSKRRFVSLFVVLKIEIRHPTGDWKLKRLLLRTWNIRRGFTSLECLNYLLKENTSTYVTIITIFWPSIFFPLTAHPGIHDLKIKINSLEDFADL